MKLFPFPTRWISFIQEIESRNVRVYTTPIAITISNSLFKKGSFSNVPKMKEGLIFVEI